MLLPKLFVFMYIMYTVDVLDDLIDNSETGNKRRHWKLDDAYSKRNFFR